MRKIMLLLVPLIVTNCSAVESLKTSNNQNLLIITPRVEGAECSLSDKAGRKWNVWETPGTVAVQEGHPPLVIICTKNGFKKSVLTINEHKEELLTIDGKRIELSVFGDFPTKFPRLVPTAIKEAAGFVQDPTGSVSTTYPDSITVWMEPKHWQSEEQMREWAFDREVQDNSEFISEQDAKLSEEQRKEKRRADQKARKEYMNKVKKRLQNAGKKGVKNTLKVINPGPAVDNLLEKGRDVIDSGPALDRSRRGASAYKEKLNDSTSRAYNAIGAEKTQQELHGKTSDFLNKRNEVREKVRNSRSGENNNDGDNTDSNNLESNDDFVKTYNSLKAPKQMPIKKNNKAPQDLYENEDNFGDEIPSDNESKYKYDDKGRRITP